MKTQERAIIAITMGDPAGVGAEVILKALNNRDIYRICRPLIIGDLYALQRAGEMCSVKPEFAIINNPDEGKYQFGQIDLVDLNQIDLAQFQYGKISAMGGKASFCYIRKAIEWTLAGRVDAIVTGPIHKKSLHEAGYNYAGHTEIFAQLTNTKDYAMMLTHGNFRVVHVSTHVSLKEAIERVKKDRIVTVIKLTQNVLNRIGINKPNIAVAGLNPHAGEEGLFGDEEVKEIIPAIEEAKGSGITVAGPIPSDTIFAKMHAGLYDATVVMYHDQGHIPTKLLGFKFEPKEGMASQISGVNITLGLPIVRTSVDHGVAFDIAGRGLANPASMMEAINWAVVLTAKTP